jgi:hypothetical protein
MVLGSRLIGDRLLLIGWASQYDIRANQYISAGDDPIL